LQAAAGPRWDVFLIRYTVTPVDLDRHLFGVECRVANPAPDQRFMLPSWIPGSYLLREFARHVVAVEAHGDGRAVAIEKVSKNAWVCPGRYDDLCLRLRVYALDQSVRGAYLDRRRGFFNGTCLLPLPEGRDAEPAELTLVPPAGAPDWRVATAMVAGAVDARGFGRYTAADYDELIDHPFELGDFASVDFEAAGVPHRFVVAGRFDADLERLATDLRQLCESQIDFFGRPAPFASYTFLGLAVGDGYGGLEHRASSSLIFRRDDLPRHGEPGVPRSYQRLLGLCSHEYFHSWHVKRTKPAAFQPYRLDRRNYTRLLWVFEGITSYYQERFLLASGLIGVEAYLRRLGEQLTRVYRVPGRFLQSLAESSFDAWDSLYKPEPQSPNVGVSYYTKGALAALALDLTLRAAAPQRTTLDAILQALWQRYGAAGAGVPEDGFEALVIELAGPELAQFFDHVIRGTEDVDLAGLMASFGLTLTLRPAEGARDVGGTPAAQEPALRLLLGALWRGAAGGVELTTVLTGGPAERAGLIPGDTIVALGGLRVDERNLEERLARSEAGDAVGISFFRGDELLTSRICLEAAPADTCHVALAADAPDAALARRRDWLGQ